MEIEIHGMAYAFDIPYDSAMSNSVFLHYKIINRSEHTYDSTFIGIHTNVDLGYFGDDYLGFDVDRNMYYGYNGDSVDGTGQLCAYGSNPPAQGIVLLSGPLMDSDGVDNPKYDNSGNQLCDFSVNGRGFGDQIDDNERYGVTYFMSWGGEYIPWGWDIWYSERYWQLLNTRWRDNSKLRYGGSGHPYGGGTGPECRFMFPGMSDTVNWGTNCVEPFPKDWKMENSYLIPRDVTGLQSIGPFTFHPGDVQEIDIAFIWARDYVNGTEGSIQLLRNYADQIKSAFEKNQLSNGQQFYGVEEKPSDLICKIYPNPATVAITIEFPHGEKAVSAELISSGGFTLRTWKLNDPKATLDLSRIPAGLYLLKIKTKAGMVMEKVIIR